MSINVLEVNVRALENTYYKTGDMSEPKVGDIFYTNKKSPWLSDYESTVVLEVLDEYVRFNYRNGPNHLMAIPHSMSIPDFMLNFCRAEKRQ